MILNEQGKTFVIEEKPFTIGGLVWANTESDYAGLFGRITEIRDGSDKETENEGADIYCDFMVPEKLHMVSEIESRFSKLYQMPKRIGELSLDGVIMAPDMLEPAAEALPESGGTLYALAYTYDSDSDSSMNVIAVSSDKATLMRAMFDDVDRFEERERYKAVLSCTSRWDDCEHYTFEPAAVEQSDFALDYIIRAVPAYGIVKGGAV